MSDLVKPPVLELTGVEVQATTYRFRTTERFGWAICTVNDVTGELLIVSDWGNWAHRWNPSPNQLGAASLTHFIGDRHAYDYIAMKLLGRRGAVRFSAEETTKKLRHDLAVLRLEDGRCLADASTEWKRATMVGTRGRKFIKAYEARELWDALGELASDIGPGDSASAETLYVERLLNLNHHEVLGQDLYEDMQHVPSPDYKILVGSILPALASACLERTWTDPHLVELTAAFAAMRAAERARPIVGEHAERFIIDDPNATPDQIIATAEST